jgi:hypothetical protein
MSATDDASPPLAARKLRARRRAATALLSGAFLGAALVGASAERFAPDRQPRYEAVVRWTGGPPAAAEWPRPRRPGERAVTVVRAGREFLAARSHTAAGAAALARDLQRRRLSGVDASSARRAVIRARWRGALVPGPLPPLPPTAECAALLRARLLLVSLADTAAAAAPLAARVPAPEQAWLERSEAEAVRWALASRPDSLSRALTACAAAEAVWLQALRGIEGPRLETAWNEHERTRAVVLDSTARALESALSPPERALVQPAALERVFALERLAPDPAAVLFVAGDWGPAPEVRPVARTWAIVLAAGALVGALAGLGVGSRRPIRSVARARGPGSRRGGAGPSDRLLGRDAQQASASELSWLHVVSGREPGRIGRAVAALAASFLERGERVLVVDAGKGLRLHERFGGDARWGLLDCLAGEAPLLGAVQAAGHAGFYFLARGTPTRAERWDKLSRLLEDARTHFGRVILVIDPRVSRAAALPLGGRVLEAWWAGAGPSPPRRALALSERLGIVFSCMELHGLLHPMLEGADRPPAGEGGKEPAVGDAGQAGPGVPIEVAPVPLDDQGARESRHAELREMPASADVSSAAAPVDALPRVLGCDVEVRERLRFLLWMRRLQGEKRSRTLETRAGG